ncbi:MAG: glycosyltransferase, partial [Chloroflexi bacterium]|nr:glycosyltransferase [Chloroflexota bacterium]
MRIAVDLRVTQGTRTGVGTIAYYQMKHVLAVDKANSYFGILLENEPSDLPQNHALTVWPTRISGSHHFRRDLWQQAYLPYKLARQGIDVFHANYGIAVFARCATVVTVHDMNPFLFSYTNPGLSAWYAKRLIAASARAATRVIADSESAKDDVVRILKLPAEKVKVVYSATDGRFSGEAISETAQQRVREKYGIHKDFILFVGAFNPRKNLSRLLQAFRLLLDRHHLDC